MTAGIAIPLWLARRPEVSGNAKLLFGILASHAGNGPARVRVAVLASEMGESYRTTRRLVMELKKHGLIRVRLNREECEASDYHLATSHAWMGGNQ